MKSGAPGVVEIRVLHLEDDPDDAELVQAALQSGGFVPQIRRVAHSDEYCAALVKGRFDVILADFKLPAFGGAQALSIARDLAPDVPFVFVSGTMGEDAAVDALKLGAVDYVLKDRLARLPSAISRALEQNAERRRLREAEARLTESEERFRRFMDANPAGALMTDATDRVVYANRAARQMLGGGDDVVGRTLAELLPEDVADELRAGAEDVLAGGAGGETEAALPVADGDPRLVSITRFPLRDVSGRPLVGAILVDVTERRRLEQQYLHAQKMEAVGRLASGVAHDFNNVLAVIGGHTELLASSPPGDPRFAKYVREILDATHRAAALTRQLLAFSRQEVTNPVVLDAGEAVDAMRDMLARVVGEDVEFEILRVKEPAPVRIDRGHLEQLVMNLVVNARDATPQGGRITIETAPALWAEVARAGGSGLEPGRYVRLTVRDTGAGMAPDTLGRIFEPFFTTKRPGEGTGLGLATVETIVRGARGHVCATSTPGAGSSFDVYLPLDESEVSTADVGRIPEAVPVGTETILVAEDDEDVRAVVRQILELGGYRVIEACDGVAALEAAKAANDPIDLVLTDVVMPRMDGPALVESLRAARPGIRVLYMSGYAGRPVADRIVFGPCTGFLQKPFTSEALNRSVREVLDRSAPEA